MSVASTASISPNTGASSGMTLDSFISSICAGAVLSNDSEDPVQFLLMWGQFVVLEPAEGYLGGDAAHAAQFE